jgi:hypothetical protein
MAGRTLAELWDDLEEARLKGATLKAARLGRNAALQADTAVRGAANVLTFGLADKAAAGLDTLLGSDSFAENLQEQENRNAYDHEHRRAAQLVGELAGTGVALGAAGPTAYLAQAPRLAGAARVSAREAASALGAGAGVGAATQWLGDVAIGRQTSIGDSLGAAAGGALGVAALPFGVRSAGAVSGGVTSGMQDILNGRAISADALGTSAVQGAILGGLAGRLGSEASNALSRKAKGNLGEAMGRARSWADWRPRDAMPKRTREPIPGNPNARYIYPDGRRGKTIYEDKFGPTAALSRNQRLMQSAIGDNFYINSFLPRDVGGIVSAPSAMLGGQLGTQRRRP